MNVSTATLDESKAEKKKKKKKQKVDEEAPEEPETPAANEEEVKTILISHNKFLLSYYILI